ncbi:MAG: type II secretion system F family protein [Nitrospiria bacterium]
MQLATLVGAGVPILNSFDSLIVQTTNFRLREVIQRIRRDVEGGSSFSGALERHPTVFSSLFVSMVHAGEAGGVLDEILYQLAALAEYEEETRSRIKSATLYPQIVVGLLLVAFWILATFVIPKLAAFYNKFDATLPLPTRILLKADTIVHEYGIYVLGLIAAAVFWVWRYIRTPSGALFWDRLKLKLPVFGPIFLKVALSRFARIFGTLTRSGLPVLRTLDIVSKTVGNRAISNVVTNIRDAAKEGRGIVQPMEMSLIFPPSIIQMVAIGEQTGQMDEMMKKVSEYYDREVDYAIRNLSKAIEPILLIFIGGAILFLALAVFMPWWNMAKMLKGGMG